MIINSKSLLAVLSLVFLIRAMMPVGFMPDFSGKHAIQICSGTEIKTIIVDDDGKPSPTNHQKTPCPYSFLSAAINSPDTDLPTIETPALMEISTSPTIQALDPIHFQISPPSRAPPSLIA
jgi:hypothetical protein